MTNRLKLYLGLARASNLPTVWTNALAAWALAGRNFEWLPLLFLAIAGSLLYSGGCTLNDAFDAQWDRKRRPERPIPSGALSAREVWLIGSVELASGLALLAWFNWQTVVSGALVVLAILLYDWLHKKSAWTVLLMGWCRVQWVVTVGIAAGGMVDQRSFAHYLCLLLFIIYVSLTARREALSTSNQIDPNSGPKAWLEGMNSYHGYRQIFRFLPGVASLVVAIVMLPGNAQLFSIISFGIAAFAFLFWVSWSKSKMSGGPTIGTFVGRALAGITLLDATFACLAWQWSGLWLMLFLPLCLLLQRRIAAT